MVRLHLSSLAALRSGSDLVYTCVPKINAFSTRSISPDLIVIPMADSKLTRGTVNKLLGQVPVDIDSTAIGMGLAIQDIEAIKLLVKSLLDRNVRVLLDASSLIKKYFQSLKGKMLLSHLIQVNLKEFLVNMLKMKLILEFLYVKNLQKNIQLQYY